MIQHVRRHRNFEKNFRKRITPDSKLLAQYEQRFALWLGGVRKAPLFDHPLTGKLAGKRAFSVTGDIRVIYYETDETIVFIDIGSHAQIYGE